MILGASLLIRIVADSSPGLHWARWLSPLGWAEQLHPLTSPAPMAFLPIAAFTAILAAGAIALAGRRDLGAGVIPSRDTSRSRLLTGPLGLAWRLTRPAAVGWAIGLAVLGLIGGLVAPAAAKAISNSADIRHVLGRLGAQPGSAAYLGVIYLIGAALTCFAAASQITATQAEEADGHAGQLLARPVSRWRWLAGRLAVAAALIIAASLAAGWRAGRPRRLHTSLGFAQLLKAGLNVAPPALFVLGAGCLAYGAWPRLASPSPTGSSPGRSSSSSSPRSSPAGGSWTPQYSTTSSPSPPPSPTGPPPPGSPAWESSPP